MFLKPKDLAQRLNVSLSTVYGLIESGRIACHRFGKGRGAVRVSEEDLAAYLANCRRDVRPPDVPRPRRVKLKHVHL